MATDLLQLDFVVKQVGLDKALTQTAKFEREIMKTVKAYEKGQITQDRYRKSLLNVKRDLVDYTKEWGKSSLSIQKANAVVQRFIGTQNTLNSSLSAGSAAAQQTARKTNQLGVLMQQSGYQIGDFAVQVQSGTNVMVAFGQQATQLVGTFAMLAKSTAAIAAFSTLGIVIPIATALAGAFMRARDSADDLGRSVKDVFDSIVARSASIGDLLEVTFTGSLGVAKQQLLGVQEVFQKLDQQAFLAKMRDSGSLFNEVLEQSIDKAQELLDQTEKTKGRGRGFLLDEEERISLVRDAEALQNFNKKITEIQQGPIDGMAKGFVDAFLTLQKYDDELSGNIAPAFKKLLEDTGLLAQFEKELTEAAKAQAREKREQAQETAQLISESLSNSDREAAALERRNAAIEGFKTKYTKLTEAQMDGELGVNEATRRAREELELINLARANNIKLTGTEYQQLVQILRTYQAQRKEAEDNVEITRIQKDATEALVQAEFKVLQAEVDLLRAKDKNAEADSLSVKLAGDRAYQAIMAKAETEEEAAALQDAANEAKDLAIEAARVANATRGAKEEAQELAKATREAERAMSALANMGDNLDKGLIKAQARVEALKKGADAANAAAIAGATFDLERTYQEAKKTAQSLDELKQAAKEYNEGLATLKATEKALAEGKKLEEAARNGKKAMDEAAKSAEELKEKIEELEDAADPFRAYNRELKILDTMLGKNQISQKAYNKAVDDLNAGLGDTIPIVGEVEQAFADWMSRGFRDFKDFVGSIKDMFIRLLADMAAAALRNRILIPITTGFMASAGGAAAGTAMGTAVGAGGIGAGLAMGAYGLGAGASAALGIGGYTSAGLFNVGANAAVATAAGASPMMATIGAAIPPLLAVAAVIGLFTKKTKLLDSGLRTTVEGFDVAIETFKVTQSSRLFGLLKGRKKTTYEAASAEIADPFIDAIGAMQQSIMDAASTLGMGEEYFKNFSYEFKLSLKGLTEDQQLQKINEEILKMGDSFASLTGHFENMNDLMATAQQRYDLETRLLQLQGDEAALLARQRELEVAATHDLNQELLAQIHALEDAHMAAEAARIAAEEAARAAEEAARQIGASPLESALLGLVSNAEEAARLSNLSVEDAFSLVKRSVDARKKEITDAFNTIMDSIQDRIKAAQDDVSVSQRILSSLESASGGTDMTRAAGMSYLRSLRGASRISDEKKLDEALRAVADPSEDLYTNFTDYQRDFQDQANVIRDLEEQASLQLSTDEKTLLQLQEEADQARQNHEAQMEALDAQLQVAVDQYNALMGIDTSVQEVGTAIAALSISIQKAQAAQAELDKLKSEQAAAASLGKTFGEAYGTGGSYKGFDQASLSGSGDLLNAANMLGVDTTGKTGAQIQQDISNASGMAVSLDNATRAQQFALGGYHSGGVRMVGERGPELEATGPSRVFSASQTRRMIQNPDLVEAVKAMKEEITELRNEQRQLGINNNKYTKRTYDLYRQWDAEGLPAERT